jgi:hypothetical protein
MSHHEKTLASIFQHPIAMNLKWHDVVKLVEHLGGKVEPAHGGRETIHLKDKQMTFHVPHGKAIDSKDEMMQIRHFLESCGVAASGG